MGALQIMDLIIVLRSLKGRCHSSNQFLGKIGDIGRRHRHSSRWHSETD